jgi:hypothetical protein
MYDGRSAYLQRNRQYVRREGENIGTIRGLALIIHEPLFPSLPGIVSYRLLKEGLFFPFPR